MVAEGELLPQRWILRHLAKYSYSISLWFCVFAPLLTDSAHTDSFKAQRT